MGSFMQLRVFPKGALYAADCERCGTSNFSHEWFHTDHNDRRDAMQAGTLRCDECGSGNVMADTFMYQGRFYAGWYTAPGYMDCTSLEFDKSKRRLIATLHELYGERSETFPFAWDQGDES